MSKPKKTTIRPAAMGILLGGAVVFSWSQTAVYGQSPIATGQSPMPAYAIGSPTLVYGQPASGDPSLASFPVIDAAARGIAGAVEQGLNGRSTARQDLLDTFGPPFPVRREETVWGRIENQSPAKLRWTLRTERNHRIGRLKNQRSVQYFLNSLTTASTPSEFKQFLKKVERTPDLADLLEYELPPLSAEEFTRPVGFAILRPDGTLSAPPPGVVGTGDYTDAVTQAWQEIEATWIGVVEDLRADRPIWQEQTARLRAAAQRWRQAAKPAARSGAAQYLSSLGVLMGSLEHPKGKARLQSFVRTQGFAFPGGTLLDLAQHVISNNVSVRSCSKGQVALRQIARDALGDLDDQTSTALNHLVAGRLPPAGGRSPAVDGSSGGDSHVAAEATQAVREQETRIGSTQRHARSLTAVLNAR
ncbi:MAG: hypothetical protein HY000_11640 [Planctomycetes bacterium]|nr:hypothetical protein [Planctomycetota bacterium]